VLSIRSLGSPDESGVLWTTLRLLVVGASQGTGAITLSVALNRSHQVTALELCQCPQASHIFGGFDGSVPDPSC